VVATLRDAVASVDPALPIAEVRSMDEILSRSMIRVTFTLLLLGIAGALALVLGLVGMYGVAAYAVTQRTGEFGIRMALGARRSGIRAMVLRHAALTAAGGAVIGLAMAWSGMRLLESLLFEVSGRDPGIFAVATVALVSVSLLAAWVPARRATRIDPSAALRAE
jgi:ABC-type antimicrobial peptide transport system permease subunit